MSSYLLQSDTKWVTLVLCAFLEYDITSVRENQIVALASQTDLWCGRVRPQSLLEPQGKSAQIQVN